MFACDLKTQEGQDHKDHFMKLEALNPIYIYFGGYLQISYHTKIYGHGLGFNYQLAQNGLVMSLYGSFYMGHLH